MTAASSSARQISPPDSALRDEDQERQRDSVIQAQAELLVRQTRTGTAGAILTALLLASVLSTSGNLFWEWWIWAGAVIVCFQARDILVRAYQRRNPAARQLLEFTGYVSASLAVIITLPAPLMFPSISPVDRGVFFGVAVGWYSVAGLVNGIHPPTYRLYLAICMFNLGLGWWRCMPPWQAAALTFMSAAGSYILVQFSRRLTVFLVESVNMRDENRRLVQQLEAALANTEEAQRARSRFLAAASHDLLQPVHALMLLCGLMQRVPIEKRGEVVQRVQVTAEAIDAMFRGLLDQARIDAGTLSAQRMAVPLAPVCDAVHAAYENRCADGGLTLTTNCVGGLRAWADPALIDRVLRNLVDNAVKFTRAGSIRVTCTMQDTQAVLTVTDTGSGIDADDLSQVCAPFFRGREARDGGVEGLGLGLAITAHMVHLMQGTIAIESQRGRGTTVRVCLQAAPMAETPRPVGGQGRVELRFKRIVLIEDDKRARDATEMWLTAHGADVVVSAGVDEALAGCEARGWVPPDFILADFLLGDDSDGLQGIATLRAALGWCPAALVSGENLAPSFLPGDVSFLSKPLRAERLEALLARPE